MNLNLDHRELALVKELLNMRMNTALNIARMSRVPKVRDNYEHEAGICSDILGRINQ